MTDRSNPHPPPNEPPSRMEPLLLSEAPLALSDVAAAITRSAEKLGQGLPPQTLASLADLMRMANCYYSNLIEGHRTRPKDIAKALQSGGARPLSAIAGDATGERLLRLALAHIDTQQWIDGEHLSRSLPDPSTTDFIQEVHRRFYSGLPQEFLRIADPKSNVHRMMRPGTTRQLGEEVEVGEHLPPSGGPSVDAFLAVFAQRYATLRAPKLGIAQRLFGIAAAHHRFLFVHPFDDGNGRVARLMSHAMMLDAGVGASGLWSMSRGLARGIRSDASYRPAFLDRFGPRPGHEQYALMMRQTDQPRLGDLDGRGNLSQRRLQEFCEWFLAIALDQIAFMEKNFRLDLLAENLVRHYVPRRRLDDRAGKILAAVAKLGVMERSAIRPLLGIQSRLATTLTAQLLVDGILASDSHKGPLRLQFGPEAAEILFPNLFSAEALAQPDPPPHPLDELFPNA